MPKAAVPRPAASGSRRHPTLFSPFRLAGLTLRNRVVMAPMSSSLGSLGGEVTPALDAFLVERARGGTGLVIVEFTCVEPRFGLGEERQLRLDDDRFIAGHAALVRRLIEAGAATCLQLHMPGRYVVASSLRGQPAAAPSEATSRHDGRLVARALESGEVEQIVDRFGEAASRAVRAGYQAIELHGAHGYLLMQFLSPLHNRRDDAWGGDARRRLAFPLAVVRRVKAMLPAGMPLLYRLSADEFRAGGLTLADMEEVVPQLVAAGVDAIDVSAGAVEGALDRIVEPMSTPTTWRLDMTARLRRAAGVPAIAVGPSRWPSQAEDALASGACDLIALGRPLLADPHWARKAEDDLVDVITPCTNCNWCMDRVRRHLPIACAENPRTGRESWPGLAFQAAKGDTAVVVGAGPAGIVAALELDAAGYATHLFEARDDIGGGLFASAMPPFKERLLWYLAYLRTALARSRVHSHLGVRAGVDEVRAHAPDLVVVAAGSQARDPGFACEEGACVIEAHEVLMGDRAVPTDEGPLVVYGGGETGCEAAETLASRGASVLLVTRSPAAQLARSAEPLYRRALLARLRANPRIGIAAQTRVVRVTHEGVVLCDAEEHDRLHACRAVLVAQGRDPATRLAEALRRAGVNCRAVGDAHEIGRIGDAVHAAFLAVRELHRARVDAQDDAPHQHSAASLPGDGP